MLPGDSNLLPDPPPPHPASREAAIGSALRRFDGIEDQPSASRPARWGWNRHPQLGFALAASLVLVIGLPAAFIAMRDRGSGPVGVSAPAPQTVQPRRTVAHDTFIPEVTPEPGSVERRAPVPPGAPPVRLQREEAVASPMTEAVAAPGQEMGYAAPPPPAPSPPPPPAPPIAQVAQKAVADGLVVTGSRIPRPNVTTQSSPMNREAANVAAERDEAADQRAPDWVLNDRSYATFLTQLQNAVRANDREAVIRLVSLPLRVNSNRTRLYRDTKSVRADYDRIFTPNVRKAILAQRFEQLFGRDQGVMIGDGEVWFDHVCLDGDCTRVGPVRIKAINIF